MKTQRRMENGRLAYYQSAADADYWDSHWLTTLSPQFYRDAEQGRIMPTLDPLYAQYLPRSGQILEAGCGLGQVVLALRVKGYDAVGVEWAEKTVAAAKAIKPDLPVRTGDVTSLNVPDSSYAAYISIGVIEHRYEGPEPFLREAYRLLQPGGIAFFSVPYLHPLRALKAKLGMYNDRVDGLDFYQYVYSGTEICQLLEAAGFRILHRTTYDAYKGLKDEILPLRWILRWKRIVPKSRRFLQGWRYLETHFGHMLMVICQKPGS